MSLVKLFLSQLVCLNKRMRTRDLVDALEHFREIAHSYLVAESVNIVLDFLVLGLAFPGVGAYADIFI